MKKEVKKQEHPFIMEEKKRKETISLGKSGGVFGLPLGARLMVPEGTFHKKDSLTFRVVSPSERWRHWTAFAGESLISEIFVVSGNSRVQAKPLMLLLPYYKFDPKVMELNVKGMWKDEFQWVDVGFVDRTDRTPPMVELNLEKLGKFLITIKPKTEEFEVGSNGCLFQSRVYRGLAIRFPKKSVADLINYRLRLESVSEERLAFCRQHFLHDCQDLLMASSFVNFNPSRHADFRRSTTVKLPLPNGVEVTEESSDEVVLLSKGLDGWHAVDSKYKFARNFVSAEIKNPTKFIVVKSKPYRQRKMESAVAVLEKRVNHVVCDFKVFLSIEDKSWMGLVEVIPIDVAQAKVMARTKMEFAVIDKTEPPPLTPKVSLTSHRPPPPPRDFQQMRIEGLEIYDGITWKLDLEGDLQNSPESDLTENNELCFFKHLPENYRRFQMVPSTEELRALTGTLTLKPQGIKDPVVSAQLTVSFTIEVSEEAMRKFSFVPILETPPEEKKKLKKTMADLMKEVLQTPPKAEPKPPPPRRRALSQGAIDRLATTSRRSFTAEKEAKVISGKSLMILSKVVDEGLTLAVHLGLPDSTITGIGFDALSNGRSMADVGYRILLYWKRSRKDKGNGAVLQLIKGLRSMSKHAVANVVEERHKENKELTMDSFLTAATAAVSFDSDSF